jgi:hypothetical protein
MKPREAVNTYWVRFGEYGKITKEEVEINDNFVREDRFYSYYADFQPDPSFMPLVHLVAYQELEAKLRIAVEALEFYANEATKYRDRWETEQLWDDDCGESAKEALKKIRGEGAV